VAEFGDDKTVILSGKGLHVEKVESYFKKSVMESTGYAAAAYHNYGADLIVVDDNGLGAGVRARLKEQGYPVMGFNSGRSARDKLKYVRLRDEATMLMAELFKDDYVSIPNNHDMIEDIGSLRYSMNSKGQICVMRKKDIKKTLGRSPDHADAMMMYCWAAKKGRNIARRPSYTPAEKEYNVLTYGL